MSGLFGAEKPTTPQPKPPAPMPDDESPMVREAARNERAKWLDRGGRASTILTRRKPAAGSEYTGGATGL